MQKIILIFLLILFIAPIINADLISPGEKPIPVKYQITNINDFSDYVFVSIESMHGFFDCPVKLISEEGVIQDYYKNCQISVYAIKRSNFDFDYISNLNLTESYSYLSSSQAKEVIKNIRTYEEVPIQSPKKSINYYYNINLNEIKEKPDKIVVEKNHLYYTYIMLSIIALLAIIIILVRRRIK